MLSGARRGLDQIMRKVSGAALFADAAVDLLALAIFLLRRPSGGPPSACGPVIEREDLSRSIREGIGFLERVQRRDGLWRGFTLGPGVAAREWISVHVVFVLEDVAQARGIRERAVSRLLSVGRRGGGWGFSRHFRRDSDSTAQGIMVMQRHGHEIAPAWVEQLLAARCEGGGFATYVPRGRDGGPSTWWEMPHPDVTLMVIEAFRRLDSCEDERREASAWLASQLENGILPAYWFPKPSYSLWAQARAGFELAETSRAALNLLEHEEDPAHLAMLISAALSEGDCPAPVRDAIARLVRKRRSDGSWLCGPCLRLTADDSSGRGTEVPGKVYPDRYRVFSTAHAVAALSLALSVLDAPQASDLAVKQPFAG